MILFPSPVPDHQLPEETGFLMALLAGRRLESLGRRGLPRHLSLGTALEPCLKWVDR